MGLPLANVSIVNEESVFLPIPFLPGLTREDALEGKIKAVYYSTLCLIKNE